MWELAVLALLREEPMHPYQMQRLLRERKEDEVLGLKRGSLYHAINRLLRSDCIEVVVVDRAGRRPERTTYRLTETGQRAFERWLRQRLAVVQPDPSPFMGSVSFLVHLPPREAIVQLQARLQSLEEKVQALAPVVRAATARVGRIHLLEKEYQLAMYRAEMAWLRNLLADLRSRRLSWDLERILDNVRAARRSAISKERKHDPRT